MSTSAEGTREPVSVQSRSSFVGGLSQMMEEHPVHRYDSNAWLTATVLGAHLRFFLRNLCRRPPMPKN